MAGSSSTATGVYLDQNTLEIHIQRMTIPQIKPLIKQISQLSGYPMPNINLRKAQLVGELCGMFKRLQDERREREFGLARQMLEEKYGSVIQPFNRSHTNDQYHHHIPHHHRPMATNGYSHPSSITTAAQHLQQQRMPAHHYSMQQNPNANHYANIQATLNNQQPPKFGQFRESPFYKLKEWVQPAKLCPAMPGQQRQSGSERIVFQFSGAQSQLLQSNGATKYQARLFCTTLNASRAAFNPNHPAPVEFPINCEVRVNRVQLSGNLRGKKTAAKVLPPDLNKDKKLNLGMGRNEVEMSYIGTFQPYIITIGICEYVTPETLTERVKKNHVKSKADVLKEMRKAADDDDIEVGDVSINLKCPLSYMRLSTPCRSNVCAHIQCFDAMSFYSVNEQTPSWQCPICSKIVDPNTIFVDGYVLDILQRVPDSEESVQIDSQGKWRTPNNKYRSEDKIETNGNGTHTPIKGDSSMTSDGQKSEERPSSPRVKGEADEMQNLPPLRSTPPPTTPSAERGETNGRKRQIEVVELDDSPSPPRKSQKTTASTNVQSNGSSSSSGNLSSNAASGEKARMEMLKLLKSQISEPPTNPQSNQSSAVIDLTFSDSEDEDIPLRPSNFNRPVVRPTGVRPFSNMSSAQPIRPPSISPRPPNLPQRPPSTSNSQRASPFNIPMGFFPAEGIAPMPLPPPPRRMEKGMQSIVQFLVNRDDAEQSNGRSSGSSSATNTNAAVNGGQSNLSRSISTPNATTNLDSRRANSTSSNLERTFENSSRPNMQNTRATSFSGSLATGNGFASGFFDGPNSPVREPAAASTNHDALDAPPSSQTQESETADEEPLSRNDHEDTNETSLERSVEDGGNREEEEEDEEDQIRATHKRSRPLLNSTDNIDEDEFADSELDQLDLDPDAGLGGGSMIVQTTTKKSTGEAGKPTSTAANLDRIHSENNNVNDGSSTFVPSSSDDIPLARRISAVTSDDEFQADERAGLGLGQ